MAENHNFEFSFAPHKEYAPHVGEMSDRVDQDGKYAVKLQSFTPMYTKGEGGGESKPAVRVVSVIEDEDQKGKKLVTTVLCGGLDRNKEDLGRQFCNLLYSSGTTEESIRQNAANGVKAPIMDIVSKLVGRTAYVEVQAALYNGNETSEVKNWLGKDNYDQAKLIAAHRRPRRQVTVQADARAANQANIGGGGIPAGVQANGTSQAATTGGNALPML